MAKERASSLLLKLDFGPEYRDDGATTPLVETGRFKYFREVGKRRNGSLLTANLMFIITFVPLAVVLILLEAFGGVESIAYKLANISSSPYILSGIGFGQSALDSSVVDIKLAILNVYYILFAFVGLNAFLVCIGFGGMLHLSAKFILNDTVATKKDNYGNEVPKAIKEFFKGIKRTWKEMCFAGGLLLVLFAGIGNLFIYFVGLFWQNKANAGHWIMIILAGIFAIFMLVFLVQYLPTTVIYDLPFKSKVKNSLIFSLQFFLQNFGIVVIFSAPIIIACVMNNIYVPVIIIAVLLVYGSKWLSLTLCNYEQYLSEKIISRIYNEKFAKSAKKQKNKKAKK